MQGHVARKRGRYHAVIYEGLDPITGRSDPPRSPCCLLPRSPPTPPGAEVVQSGRAPSWRPSRPLTRSSNVL
jgi:hypothetical protein